MRIRTADPELSNLFICEYAQNHALRPSMLALWMAWLIEDGLLRHNQHKEIYDNIDYFRPLACFSLIEPYLVDRDWPEEELTARRVAYLLTKD